MKQAIIVIVLIAAGSVLAHLHVASQTYNPVVKIAAPEGLVYTVVQEATGSRRGCGAANDRFLAPLKQSCRQCKIVYARCERALEGLEQSLQDGIALPHHLVEAPGLRMAIVGPAAQAKRTCDFLAGDMVRRGLPSAACVYPRVDARGKS